MIQSAATGSGVKITGINPQEEARVTNLHSKLIEGDYFETSRRNPIVIGKKLAEKLKVKLKSKVVITLQDLNGVITSYSIHYTKLYD